jgi:hypothetical protein
MTTIEIFDTIVYPDETELIDAIKIVNRGVRQKIENFKSELKKIDVSESKFPVFVYISGIPTLTPPNPFKTIIFDYSEGIEPEILRQIQSLQKKVVKVRSSYRPPKPN